MSDREDNVYKAKLAEQAERYDGKSYHNFFVLLVRRVSVFRYTGS